MYFHGGFRWILSKHGYLLPKKGKSWTTDLSLCWKHCIIYINVTRYITASLTALVQVSIKELTENIKHLFIFDLQIMFKEFKER